MESTRSAALHWERIVFDFALAGADACFRSWGVASWTFTASEADALGFTQALADCAVEGDGADGEEGWVEKWKDD